jgi:hypothetical protein
VRSPTLPAKWNARRNDSRDFFHLRDTCWQGLGFELWAVGVVGVVVSVEGLWANVAMFCGPGRS